MPSQKNISTVEQLASQLAQAKAVVLADYRGLSVADMGKLRQAISAAGGSLQVAKNTLIKIALGEKKLLLENALQGPTALLLTLDDQVAPIKALVDFAKDHQLPTPKAGLLDDRVLTPEEINQLASLPSRDQLLAQLVGQLQAPAYGLVSVLSANFRKLVYVLKEVKTHG